MDNPQAQKTVSSASQALPKYRQLTFLNDDASSVAQRDEKRRKTVRRHVMLDVHRRSRQAATQRLRESRLDEDAKSFESDDRDVNWRNNLANSTWRRDAGLKPAIVGTSNRELQQLEEERSPSKDIINLLACEQMWDRLNPITLLNQDISDPFNSLSLSVGRLELQRIHHFFHNILPSRQNFQSVIWNVYNSLLDDPAVLVFVLAKAFLHLAMITSAGAGINQYSKDIQFLQYKLQGTRLIGQKLTTNDGISDGNFLALVDLVTCYTCSGEYEEAFTHLRGLRQMLKLRGGMETLSAFLAYRVILADTTVAAMTGELPLIEVPRSIERGRDRKIVASISSFSSMEIATSFSILRCAFGLEDFNERVSANLLFLERDLLVESRIYREDLPKATSKSESIHTAETMRLSTIIYIELNIVRSWRNSHIIRNLVERLMEVLERTPMHILWLPYPNVLLLVLLIGGIGCCGRSEKAWFVANLRLLRGTIALNNFEEVRIFLGVTHLLEGDTEALMEQLWREVVA